MKQKGPDKKSYSMPPRTGTVGVVARDLLREKSGLEFLTAMLDGKLPGAPIGKTLDFSLIACERGLAVFQGRPKLDFYNPIGSVHGGWAATLLDSCMGCAVHTMLEAGQGYTTAELHVNYVRALEKDTGPVRAEGRVIHAGRRIATAEGKLFGADDRLYAHGTTTCLVYPI